MNISHVLFSASALAPVALMLVAALLPRLPRVSTAGLWRAFLALSVGALVGAGCAALAGPSGLHLPAGLRASPLGLGMALLVQLLGTVIGGFSARYLHGETGQRRYAAALAGVLAAVHLLLMANHWVVLIMAWALVGVALQHLLCFYPDRVFARLAAHKKRIADRGADALLVGAAALAWSEVGSGSFSDLWAHLGREGMSTPLQISAVGLVLAVVLRTALLPVHGWLIQVMEAPTPVSALLHAGVVNLGGFVLIRFAPLLEQAKPARALLLVFGLGTAVLAGMVMLTRISIKVRLAWSTVAQMGFMLLECGLGLYTLAALHLIGHSLYKAHAFLSASTVVRQTRRQAMHGPASPAAISLVLAPAMAVSAVQLVQLVSGHTPWPWWWSAVLGLAWAPILWLPAERSDLRAIGWQGVSGVLMVAGLTGAALLSHALPLDIQDVPDRALGLIALLGMVGLYICLVVLQLRPQALRSWRRWSYAGFYVDEAYTRLALHLWPACWTPAAFKDSGSMGPTSLLADAPR
jgi:NADH:ubiquinone oxidoreductase subunit 5 (subunit L)/multisubunit Na+/H+ antiporter MnhA subunit